MTAKAQTTKEKVTKAPKAAPAQPAALVTYDGKKNYLQVGAAVQDLIASLPSLNDKQLRSLFQNTVDAERAMFVVRGAAAHEIYKRAVADGQKFDKTKGNGIDTLINEVAKEVGIDGKTLYSDFKVFDEFGGYLIEQLTTAPDTIMPREYYVLATKVSRQAQELPMNVLEYFQEQRESTGGYFTDQARRDTKLFNEGKTVEQVKKLDAETRIEAVSGTKTKAAKLPKEHYATIKIVATKQNVDWYRQIIDTYGSFEEWFKRKCKEEFGGK